jgi:hypothetical protein
MSGKRVLSDWSYIEFDGFGCTRAAEVLKITYRSFRLYAKKNTTLDGSPAVMIAGIE